MRSRSRGTPMRLSAYTHANARSSCICAALRRHAENAPRTSVLYTNWRTRRAFDAWRRASAHRASKRRADPRRCSWTAPSICERAAHRPSARHPSARMRMAKTDISWSAGTHRFMQTRISRRITPAHERAARTPYLQRRICKSEPAGEYAAFGRATPPIRQHIRTCARAQLLRVHIANLHAAPHASQRARPPPERMLHDAPVAKLRRRPVGFAPRDDTRYPATKRSAHAPFTGFGRE